MGYMRVETQTKTKTKTIVRQESEINISYFLVGCYRAT